MDKKLIYRVLLKFMILIAITFMIYTFSADFMKPNDEANPGDSIQVDVSRLGPGQDMRVRWDGRGIIVLRRSQETQRQLREAKQDLADPYSQQSRQPEGTEHPLRSLRDEFLVAWLPAQAAECRITYIAPSTGQAGRLKNTCSGQTYDLSGRAILTGKNLDIPEHRWLSPELLVILR